MIGQSEKPCERCGGKDFTHKKTKGIECFVCDDCGTAIAITYRTKCDCGSTKFSAKEVLWHHANYTKKENQLQILSNAYNNETERIFCAKKGCHLNYDPNEFNLDYF